MKKKVLAVSFVMVMAVFVSNAFATNGMRLIGFGPVQRSMGGVGVGLALDASSVLTNPAGMSELKGRIDFGASYFAPSVEYSAQESDMLAGMGYGGFVVQDEKAFKSDKGASPIPAFGLIIPINENMNFGIGAYGIAGMGVDYPQNVYGGVLYSSYSQMRFAPGISYKINDMISIGVVVNLMYATMEYSAAAGFGQTAHMGASSFGYGATIGVKVSPMKMLTVGIAYESKSTFEDFEFNSPSHDVIDETFTPQPVPAGKDKLEFNQPQTATIGVGITPIKGLSIGIDVQWINWSSTNGEDQPEYSESNGAMPWNLDWEDQIVYKAGIAYEVIPMLTVRLGYNYGKMPLNEDRAFENIAFPAIAEQHYTFGIGLNLGKKFALNIGGMYSPEATLEGANEAGQYIKSYETTMSQYSVDIGLSYTY